MMIMMKKCNVCNKDDGDEEENIKKLVVRIF